MGRKKSKSRDSFDSSLPSLIGPFFVLLLSIAGGMGLTSLFLNRDEKSSHAEIAEQPRTLKRIEKAKSSPSARKSPVKVQAEVSAEPDIGVEADVAPRSEVKIEPPVRKQEQRVSSSKIKPSKAVRRVASKKTPPRAVAPSAPPLPKRVVTQTVQRPIAVPSPTPERAVETRSIVIQASERSPEGMEDLTLPPTPKVQAQVQKKAAPLAVEKEEEEEEDKVFDLAPTNFVLRDSEPKEPSPPVSSGSSPKAKEKVQGERVERQASSGPKSFQDRLKKSHEKGKDKSLAREDNEESLSESEDKDGEADVQAATRGFQNRLKKSVK